MRIRFRLLFALVAVAALVVVLGRGRRAAPWGEGVVSSTELDTLTRDELYQRARALELPGRSKMNKAELLEALRAL